MGRIRRHLVVILIAVILFFVPFFWLAPGEIDLGSDSTRLYLYDPLAYLKSIALFSVDPQGLVKVVPNQYLLPFISLNVLIYGIFRSSYVLVSLEKSIKLVASFLFIYLIVRRMLVQQFKERFAFAYEAASILAGIFYTFSPAVSVNMGYALLTHNQVFLNPLIFYLLFLYLVNQRGIYLWFTLFLTLIFSPNFSLVAPPPPFAFYPLALLFLYFYVTQVLRRSIPWKGLVFGAIFFLGLHAFHLIPSVAHLFDPESDLHQRAIEASVTENPGLAYFNAIVGLGKVSNNLLLAPTGTVEQWTSWIAFGLILGGFLLNKHNKRVRSSLFLIGVFFFTTLFLVSANITNLGVELYRKFFLIPGFGMFRNFIGQWQFVYAFFYALLFGVTTGIFLSRWRVRWVLCLSGVILGVFIYRSWPFLTGKLVDVIHRESLGVRVAVKMDPRYEETLTFIRALPPDGKILTLPLSDFYIQIVHGVNNGAYAGPSTIPYLTGRNDFAGYQIMGPFPEVFMRLAREKRYKDVKHLLALLNIRYIFYNSDPNVYEEKFPTIPYSYVRGSLPKTQSEYSQLNGYLAKNKIYENGPYKIFEMESSAFVPQLYVPKIVKAYQDDRDDWYGENKSFFVGEPSNPRDVVYVQNQICQKIFSEKNCQQPPFQIGSTAQIKFRKVNPTKYEIAVNQADLPFVLVLSNKYDYSWKLYPVRQRSGLSLTNSLKRVFSKFTLRIFSDPDIFQTAKLKPLPEKQHFRVNGYANAWYVVPIDLSTNNQYHFVLEVAAQKIFYQSLIISLIFIFVFLLWGIGLIYALFKNVI
ncbi:MAG: hypothetical protein ACOY0S_01665 [Patescibacteria group bacterium]